MYRETSSRVALKNVAISIGYKIYFPDIAGNGVQGVGGHNVPEWVVTMQRNRWSVCSGMSGHNAAEYALE